MDLSFDKIGEATYGMDEKDKPQAMLGDDELFQGIDLDEKIKASDDKYDIFHNPFRSPANNNAMQDKAMGDVDFNPFVPAVS